MKILIINNLASGQYDTAIYDFIRSAARDGDEICLRNTDGTTPISALVEDARTFDRVVAAGGDGTVACVMYALRYSGIPVLPFPSGTANLLSMNLQNPEEPHALAALLRDGRILDFDMGEISTENDSRGFAIMAGSGYDATLMATPQRSDIKLTIDGVSYETK
uniref:diacylglycerol/lipid kinase family protein n=1 Tax=Slackia exigua TaxID=84109 RepID=UPI0028E1F7D0